MPEGPAANFTLGLAGELAETLFDVGAAEDDDDQGEDDDTDTRPRDRLYARLMPLWGGQ